MVLEGERERKFRSHFGPRKSAALVRVRAMVPLVLLGLAACRFVTPYDAVTLTDKTRIEVRLTGDVQKSEVAAAQLFELSSVRGLHWRFRSFVPPLLQLETGNDCDHGLGTGATLGGGNLTRYFA